MRKSCHYNIPDDDKESLKITKKQLIHILDCWQKALNEKPNKIVITKDDNDEIKVDFED